MIDSIIDAVEGLAEKKSSSLLLSMGHLGFLVISRLLPKSEIQGFLS